MRVKEQTENGRYMIHMLKLFPVENVIHNAGDIDHTGMRGPTQNQMFVKKLILHE